MAAKPVGWEKVWDIYPITNFLKSVKIPSFLALSSTVGCLFFSSTHELELMKLMADVVTTGFPSILGFVLTGYALIIGFSGSEFLLRMAKSRADEEHTLFERVNATFAIVIGILVVTYIFSVSITYFLKLQIAWPFANGIHVFNRCILFLLLFFLYYSICALLDIVINIFNLGQLANVIASNKLKLMENLSEEKEEADNDNWIKKINLKLLHSLFGL